MSRLKASLAMAAVSYFFPALALAHVSVASGVGIANTTQEVTFSVGHGCAGADTNEVSIEIPAGVTSVRPETSDFGQVDVETDDAGSVVLVSWKKSAAAALKTDTQFYKLTVRLKLPDAPFSTVYFPAHQTCLAADGTSSVVDWVGLDASAGSMEEPAPVVYVVPARFPGWNQFTVAQDVSDLSLFFKDAQIVWKDSAAYSINPTTVTLISGTDGVNLLSSLATGDSVWVKY
ncbi:MAG: YcnI family protein [Polyangiaceae bacterium]